MTLWPASGALGRPSTTLPSGYKRDKGVPLGLAFGGDTGKNDTYHIRKIYTELSTKEEKIEIGHEKIGVLQVEKSAWNNLRMD